MEEKSHDLFVYIKWVKKRMNSMHGPGPYWHVTSTSESIRDLNTMVDHQGNNLCVMQISTCSILI